ncbi:MAG: ABC transporter substrate-binding protein [Actinomycetota bacterium]|nr:ABC transporter substrate-binding protein [Actinomycetota bacterium]
MTTRNRSRRWALAPVALLAIPLAACGGSGDDRAAGAADSPERGAATEAAEPVTIGMFEITSGAVFDEISDGFVDGFLEGTGLAPDQITLVEENAQGDPSLIQSIARGFAEGDADMVAVVGTPAVIAQAELIDDRPVIAMAMGDPVGAGVAESLDAPGGNVTGSIDYIDPALLVDDLVAVHPDLASIGTVHDPANQNMQVWVEDLRATTTERDIELVEASATGTSEVDAAARSLDGRVEVVLTGPDTMVIEAIGAVGQVARRGDIPLYTVGADVEVEGVVAALGPDYGEVGRLAGIAAAEVHLGSPAGEVAFGRPGALEWTLDDAEADRLGLSIPAELLGPSS